MSEMSVISGGSGGGVQSSQVTLHDSSTDQKFGDKGCWARRTTLERCLLFWVLLFLVASIGLVVALVIVRNKESGVVIEAPDLSTQMPNTSTTHGGQGPHVCTTIDCVTAASQVASKIDFSVDPCEDFYSYACGTWLAKTVIPEDRSEYDQIDVVRDEVKVILKNILEDNKTYADVAVLNKPKRYYSACMDIKKIEEVGDAPLRALLQNLGGWPLLDSSWDPRDFSLTNTLVQLYFTVWSPPLYDFYIGRDTKNSSTRILFLDEPELGTSGRFYLGPRNASTLMAYQTLMLNIATALGADPHMVQGDVQDVVDFEIQLANISATDDDSLEKSLEERYTRFTLPELNQNFSGAIDWVNYAHQIFGNPDVNVTLEPEEPIIVKSSEYFSRLVELLDTTPNRTVANCMMWRVAMSHFTLLSEKYRNIYQEYRKVVYGKSAPTPRFQHCVNSATGVFGLAVGHMFVKKAFDESAKDMVLGMIVDLKKAFNEQLDELGWMDEETKALAREKIKYIHENIGYPDVVLNVTLLTLLYEDLKPQADDYFGTVMSVIENYLQRNLRALRYPVPKHGSIGIPSRVNAFYSPTTNQIMFPAGILQLPFFSKARPKSLNFGGIGIVIGHEMTHGFDNEGRQYDKDGNLRQWWSDGAVKRFKEQAQCLVNQYGNFTVPEANMKMNGVRTLGENIADNGGVQESFMAYRDWVKGKRNGREEDPLPGLNFTHNQLFFLSFAQIWCDKLRREGALRHIFSAVHSPGRFRVIGPLQNSEDFAKAFNCPRGSYMNPEHKCIVW